MNKEVNLEENQISKADFWEITTRNRTLTSYEADSNLAFIGTADLSTLKDIYIQYRFFTKYFRSCLLFAHCEKCAMLDK